MKLYYWKSPGNFGDDLNAWIWDLLLPGWSGWDDDTTLWGVGTIFNANHLADLTTRRLLVVGSGVGYGPTPRPAPEQTWDIRSVRGPSSARRLGLETDKGIIDPAAMLARRPGFGDAPKRDRPIFVPHFSSLATHDWGTVCRRNNVDLVSPAGEAREVIAQIAAAPLVLAESMHAAILADAFRVPWIAVSITGNFNAPKWMDWGESLLIRPDIHPLFPALAFISDPGRKKAAQVDIRATGPAQGAGSTAPGGRVSWKRRLRLAAEARLAAPALRRVGRARPQLSREADLNETLDRYQAVLDRVCRDYTG